MFRAALRLLLAAALCAVPSLVRADVYRWVDESGATHYATSREAVPRAYRDAAEVIKPPPTGIENPSAARPPERPPEPAKVEPAPVEPPPPVEAAPPAPAGRASESVTPDPTPSAAPAPAPAPEPQAPAPTESESSAPPPKAHGSGDPRADEIAQLEGQIERDRETLRQLISTPRWDSAELASDPRVREIAERLPRLQAELSALRTEAGR